MENPYQIFGHDDNQLIKILNAVRRSGLYSGKVESLSMGIDADIIFDCEPILEVKIEGIRVHYFMDGFPLLVDEERSWRYEKIDWPAIIS